MAFQNLSNLHEPEPELEHWSISSEKKADFLRSLNPGSKIQEVQVFPLPKTAPSVRFERGLSKGRHEGEVALQNAEALKTAPAAEAMQGEYTVRPSGPPPPQGQVYEAAVVSLFMRSIQESLDERFEAAEALRNAFKISEDVHAQTLLKAQNAAEYHLADLEARIEALLNNRGPSYTPASFPSPQLYNIWRDEEVAALKALQNTTRQLPAMNGTLTVQLNSGTVKIGSGGLFACGTPQSDGDVYISASVSSTKGMGFRWRSKAVSKAKLVSWNQKSVPLTATNPQDELVFELWESKGRQDSKIRRISEDETDAKSPSSRDLVDDKLLGEGRISFGEIERLSGRAGGTGVKATTPETEIVFTAAGGKRKGTVMVRVAWTVERHSTGRPTDPSLIALLPNAEAVYDALLRKAWEEKDLRSAGSRWKYEVPPMWQYILESFADHHRVRTAHCHLAALDKLTKAFRTDTAYLDIIVDEWREPCRLALLGRLTKDENMMQSIIVKALEAPAVQAITNFDTEFPRNQPPGALAALLQLLGLIVRFDPDPSKLELQLADWTETAMQRAFARILFGSANPSDKQLTVTSVTELTRACREIQAMLGEHATIYGGSFPRNLPLVQLTGTSLYRQLIDHLKVFLASSDTKAFTRTYQDLVIALHELNITVDQLGVVLPAKFDIPEYFDDYVLSWAAGTTSRLVDWIHTNVTTEKWVPASQSKDRVFFSTSVVDLFCLLEQVVQDINPQLVQQDIGHRFLAAMEGAMCTAVEAYVTLLEKECLKELPHEGDDDLSGVTSAKKKGGLEEHRPPVCITQSLCVKLNNLSMTRKLQKELELRLADEWSGVAGRPLPKTPYPKTPYELALEEKNVERYTDEDDDLPYSDSDSEDLGFKEGELEDFAAVNKSAGGEARPFVGKHFGELIAFVDRACLDVMGAIVECIQANMLNELRTAVVGKGGALSMEKRLVPLTEYLDEYLAVMNGHLMPHVFRRMLEFLWAALVDSMEEMALHADDEQPPLTRHQKDLLEQGLDVLSDYFHGDGAGLPTETMQSSTKRLRRILTLFNASTRELAGLYWRAWERRQRGAVTIKGAPGGSPTEGSEEAQQNEQDSGPELIFGHEADGGEELLSVLDYMALLKQRPHDQEASELVMMQQQAAGSYTVQQVFGLPEGEVLAASFRCHNSRKHKGTLFVCQHFVAFKTLLTHTGDAHSKLVLPLEKVARLDKHRAGGLYVGLFNRQPVKFGGLKKQRDEAFDAIVQQTVGTGWYLERYLGEHIRARTGAAAKEMELRRYKTSRWSHVQNQPGDLICYGTYLCFSRPDHDKLKQIRYDDIKDIRVGHRGLTQGVKIETRAGKQYLFTKFADVQEPTVVAELRRLVFNEASEKAASALRPKLKLLTFSQKTVSNSSIESKAPEISSELVAAGEKEAPAAETGPGDLDAAKAKGGMRKLLSRKASAEGATSAGAGVTSAVAAEAGGGTPGKTSKLRSFAKSVTGKAGKGSPAKAPSEAFLKSEEAYTPQAGGQLAPMVEPPGAEAATPPGGKTSSSRFAAARNLARGFAGKGSKTGPVEEEKAAEGAPLSEEPVTLEVTEAVDGIVAPVAAPELETPPVVSEPGKEMVNGESGNGGSPAIATPKKSWAGSRKGSSGKSPRWQG